MDTPVVVPVGVYTQVKASLPTGGIQVYPNEYGSCVEFVAAASQPAITVRGLVVCQGGTVKSDEVGMIGSSGALWANANFGPATVRTW